jgi:acyl-coenzyme A thioesterase PaaI-like protein
MLTVEYKINLIAPADGEKLIAIGRVVKPGRTLTICEMEVAAVKDGAVTVCARGMQTLIRLDGRPDRPGG